MKPRRLTPAQQRRLKHQLVTTPSKRVYRRTLGVLEYGQGESATRIARRLGVHRSRLYQWWQAYCSRHDPAALGEGLRCGRPCLWTPECSRWLERLLNDSPRQWGWLAVAWTVPLLQAAIEDRLGRRFAQGTLRQALHDLGYVWIRPRYVLSPDPELEKKSPDSPANRGLTAPQRAVGRG